MKNHLLIQIIVLGTVVAVFTACAKNKPAVVVVSSSDSTGYAETYPAKLDALRLAYTDRSEEARKKTAEFPSYADQLKEPNWTRAADAIERANAVGQSKEYAQAVEEAENVRVFFEEGQDDIVRRLTGTVKSELEKVDFNQDIEFYGKLAYSYKEAVNKQIDEHLKTANDARLMIDREKEAIGAKNAKALEKQVDAVALTRYTVSIELPELWLEIDRLVSEKNRVRSTLKDAVEKERNLAKKPDISKAEKQECEKRIASLEAVLAALDGSVNEAKNLISDQGAQIDSIRKEYRQSYDALLQKYRDNAALRK